jgi:putative MATE family efflux protein
MNKSGKTPMNQDRAELGEAPIGRLLVKMSLPATFAMLINGLYNLVDTIFIGRGVGTEAIGGLALAFPAQMIIMGFGFSIGQGASSIVSRSLGAQNDARARRAAGNAFALALTAGLLILVSGRLFLEPLLNLLGAEGALREHARSYLSVILLGSPFIMLAMSSNNLLRAEGKARVSMVVMLVGALTNIILDPIFIFVFRMGVAGAAWATVIGQFLAFLYASIFFIMKKSLVQVRIKHWIPRGSVIREIVLLGFPTFIRQGGQSVVGVLLNNMLGIYGGAIYISAYGVVNRLIMFLMMPLFGTVQGFQPIAGFNYGAGLFHRVRRTLKITFLYATAYTTVGFLLLFFMTRTLAGIFTTDPELIDTVTHVIHYVFAVFPLVGIQIVGGTYFLVIGKSFPSLVLNLSRQFLLLIPLLLILPGFFGLTGLLVSFPVADFLATLITVIWLMAELKHLSEDV